jgi:hypothetical protein
VSRITAREHCFEGHTHSVLGSIHTIGWAACASCAGSPTKRSPWGGDQIESDPDQCKVPHTGRNAACSSHLHLLLLLQQLAAKQKPWNWIRFLHRMQAAVVQLQLAPLLSLSFFTRTTGAPHSISIIYRGGPPRNVGRGGPHVRTPYYVPPSPSPAACLLFHGSVDLSSCKAK